ncbi:uncharacterized protein [Miscanthus floridulus]|uniref:uncharacterized protein n=1 Tax=Miscanthus floridulus TaxID=154761 RepID=UPI00345A08E8
MSQHPMTHHEMEKRHIACQNPDRVGLYIVRLLVVAIVCYKNQLDSKDSSRDFQLNCECQFFLASIVPSLLELKLKPFQRRSGPTEYAISYRTRVCPSVLWNCLASSEDSQKTKVGAAHRARHLVYIKVILTQVIYRRKIKYQANMQDGIILYVGVFPL